MTLDLDLVVGPRRREREVAAADDVDAVANPTAKVRLRTVDAGVEERDGDTAAVEAGQRDLEAVAAPRLEVPLVEDMGGNRRRKGAPHRVHALHLRQPLEDRDGARVERGREADDHALEGVVGRDRQALDAELRQHELLCRPRLLRPAALIGVAGAAAGVRDVVGKRRGPEDDDHALPGRDAGARRAGEPGPGHRRALPGGAAVRAAAGRDEDERDDEGDERERPGVLSGHAADA